MLLWLPLWNLYQTVKKARIVCILAYFMDGVSNFQTFNIVLLYVIGMNYTVNCRRIQYLFNQCVCYFLKLKPVMPQTYHIRLEGNVLERTTSIRHVGHYIRKDLSGSDEIRHKQCDFIGGFNGLLSRYHDVKPEVLMQLTNSFCTHLYGSQVWQCNDTNVYRMFTTWNKAIRRIWNLPTHSHRVLLCGLNEGNHVYD